MKEFEPSEEFVSKVMRAIRVQEVLNADEWRLLDKSPGLRRLAYAVSSCGAVLGVLFSPAVCL